MDKALEALERIAGKQIRVDHGSVIKHVTLEQIDPEAIATIRSALSGGWVSVEERLPEDHGHYVVETTSGDLRVYEWYEEKSCWAEEWMTKKRSEILPKSWVARWRRGPIPAGDRP